MRCWAAGSLGLLGLLVALPRLAGSQELLHHGAHAGHHGSIGQGSTGQGSAGGAISGVRPIDVSAAAQQSAGAQGTWSNSQMAGYHHHHRGGVWNGGVWNGGVPGFFVYPGYYPTYVIPPLVVPADTMYGPLPMMRFLGLPLGGDDGVAGVRPAVVNNAAGNNGPVANNAAGGNAPPRKPRATNAAAKARAGKFIQFGDSQFAKQKFHQALERYREAVVAAPDLADGFFRQGLSLFATGQYESAFKALQRGLRIQPNWAEADFELATVYGPDSHLLRQSHREALAQAIENNPQSADLLALMAIVLYFDGDRERSRLFFEHATALGANDENLLDGFVAPGPRDADRPGPFKPVPVLPAPGKDAAAKNKEAARPQPGAMF